LGGSCRRNCFRHRRSTFEREIRQAQGRKSQSAIRALHRYDDSVRDSGVQAPNKTIYNMIFGLAIGQIVVLLIRRDLTLLMIVGAAKLHRTILHSLRLLPAALSQFHS